MYAWIRVRFMFTIPWIYDQNETFEDPITFPNTAKYKHSSSNGNTRTITVHTKMDLLLIRYLIHSICMFFHAVRCLN